MSPLIQQRVDAAKLAARGTHLQQVVPVREFPRLSMLTESDGAEAAIDLAFSFSDAAMQPRVPLLDGRVEARLSLRCQRCLEPVAVPLACEFHLALLDEEMAAEPVPPPYESVVRDEEPHDRDGWDLMQLVEDELLLSLPFSPVHEEAEECERLTEPYGSSENADRQTPFAGLKDLIMEK